MDNGGILKMAAVATLLALASCGPVPGAVRPGETFTTRELDPDEKAALAAIISQSLKDPEAARFKWMPVILRSREGVTDYCGLVNGKNSYGGYIGYMRFYGQLMKDGTGRFTRIDLRAIESPASDVNIFQNGLSPGVCVQYGYVDFGPAHP